MHSTSPPALSLVIVTWGGIADLAVALPGILAQTIAHQIELIIVARNGAVNHNELSTIVGLHSVQLVEKSTITNRGEDAAEGIAVARAPFVGLHENHTRAEPQTYERILEAFKSKDAGLAPVIYPANPEMPWAQAMFAMAHHHASPPNSDEPKAYLVLHHAVYRTHLAREFGEGMRNESLVQSTLVEHGHNLRYVIGTVVWHINEGRPLVVLSMSFAIGRLHGHNKRGACSPFQRALRLALTPMIVTMHALRCVKNAGDQASSARALLRALPHVLTTGAAFGFGEVIGYFDKERKWLLDHELTEFHIRGRFAGRRPRYQWLQEAVHALPAETP